VGKGVELIKLLEGLLMTWTRLGTVVWRCCE